MNTKNLLIEIGTEDLPSKKLLTLNKNLGQAFFEVCKDFKIFFEPENLQVFNTPRRLVITVKNFPEQTKAENIKRRGPNLNTPKAAQLGFAKSCGVDISELEIEETKQGSWLIFNSIKPSQNIEEILGQIIYNTLTKIPSSKYMHWGNAAADTIAFLRPIRWVLIGLDNKFFKIKIPGLDNITSDNYSYGHRFLAPNKIYFNNINNYFFELEKHKVVANQDTRKNIILNEVNILAGQNSAQAFLTDALLEEITGLVEWPIILLGKFSPDFLKLPKEVLISSIIDHQKCIPLEDKNNPEQLLPMFIIVSNMESDDYTQIITGNERVIHARLSDSKFIFERDKKILLNSRIKLLDNILVHKKLGSLAEQAERLAKFCHDYAPRFNIDPKLAEKTGLLSKTDLTTLVVNEFPNLQGVIGGYYAKLENQPQAMAIALQEQYLPKSKQDLVPGSKLGILLALGDKIEKITGYFSIDIIPTGEKDPFALRRAAQGLVRIIMENGLDIKLTEIFNYYLGLFNSNINKNKVSEQLILFCLERLKNILLEQNYSTVIIDAILHATPKPDSVVNIVSKVKILQNIYLNKKSELDTIIELNKRINNILRQAKTKYNINLDNLNYHHNNLNNYEQDIINIINQPSPKQQEAYINNLLKLQNPIKNFFDNVMIFDDNNPDKTELKLSILVDLQNMFFKFADFSRL